MMVFFDFNNNGKVDPVDIGVCLSIYDSLDEGEGLSHKRLVKRRKKPLSCLRIVVYLIGLMLLAAIMN